VNSLANADLKFFIIKKKTNVWRLAISFFFLFLLLDSLEPISEYMHSNYIQSVVDWKFYLRIFLKIILHISTIQICCRKRNLMVLYWMVLIMMGWMCIHQWIHKVLLKSVNCKNTCVIFIKTINYVLVYFVDLCKLLVLPICIYKIYNYIFIKDHSTKLV